MATSNPAEGNFLHDFFFRRRQGKLNWRKLAAVDLDRVVSEVDIDALQENVEHITFADLSEEDLYNLSDANFVQLFRLCQLIIEYLLNVQNFLLFQQQKKDAIIEDYKSELEHAKLAFVRKEEQIKELKAEVKFQKKVIKAYEKTAARGALVMQAQAAAMAQKPASPLKTVWRCQQCRAAFVSEAFLESHIERRHKQAEQPAPAPASQGSSAPLTLEALEQYRAEIERKTREKILLELNAKKEFEFTDKLSSIESHLKELKSPRAEEKRPSAVSRLRDEDEAEKTAAELAALREQQRKDREALEEARRKYEEELERARRERELLLQQMSPRVDEALMKAQLEREREAERARDEERRRAEQLERELRELEAKRRAEMDEESRKRLEELEKAKRSEAEAAELRSRQLAEEAARQALSRAARERLVNAVTKFESGEIVLFADMPFLTSRVPHSADEMRSAIQYFAGTANEFSNPLDLGESKLDQLHRDMLQEGIEHQHIEREIADLTKQYCTDPPQLTERSKMLEKLENELEKTKPANFAPSKPMYQPPKIETQNKMIAPMPPLELTAKSNQPVNQSQSNTAAAPVSTQPAVSAAAVTPAAAPAPQPSSAPAPVSAPVSQPAAVSAPPSTTAASAAAPVSAPAPASAPVSFVSSHAVDEVQPVSLQPSDSPVLKSRAKPAVSDSPQFSSAAAPPSAPVPTMRSLEPTGNLELSDEEPEEEDVKPKATLHSALKKDDTPAPAAAPVKSVHFADDVPASQPSKQRAGSVQVEDFEDEPAVRAPSAAPITKQPEQKKQEPQPSTSQSQPSGGMFALRDSAEFDGNRSLNFAKPNDFFDDGEAEVSVDVDDIQEIH